jgi:hypothetical protein
MAVNTQWGELLVGAYHQRVTGAEVVSYNNRSEEQGDQMEADVIAVNTDRESGDQTVHVCEVVTHLDGGLYSGTPDGDDWAEYAENDAYQKSLEKLWRKFNDDLRYANDTFPNADELTFEFWAPVVTGWQKGGDLIDGLGGLSERFESENDEPLKVIINQDDTSDYGSSAFRFLQILENLK